MSTENIDYLRSFIASWRAEENPEKRLHNNYYFIQNFLCSLNDLNDFSKVKFDGQNTYGGRQATINLSDDPFGLEPAFEIAWGDEFGVTIYTANHNGYWMQPYVTASVGSAIHTAIMDCVLALLARVIGLAHQLALDAPVEQEKKDRCKLGDECNCGGDLPRIRESCSSWIAPQVDLQYEFDASQGLWATDKPEHIPSNIAHLFFKIDGKRKPKRELKNDWLNDIGFNGIGTRTCIFCSVDFYGADHRTVCRSCANKKEGAA